MKVWIKKFDVNMEVKSKGIEFEIRTPDDEHQLGDCYVTMTGLIWCKGKTEKNNGIKIKWQELIEILTSPASKRAALKAAKDINSA